ncbi:MAG: glycosyltransferase family 39 protein [Planctomycetaceae bacterium]|nr:glycosyltransferase family 39 protein [Planctomycetales bacterium]MCB9927316.1 glycosyltransferase family 39 protein [Planctomycetaceae bacterium]
MPQRDPERRILIGLVILAAFGLRLGAAYWWESRLIEGQQFAWGDSWSYWTLAGQIARGEPYQYGYGQSRIFRTPGYPVLLAGLYLVAGKEPPVMWARVLGVVCGTLAVAAVMWLTRELFSTRAAIYAGVMAALYPGAIGMSVFVLSEAPFCPLMVLQLIFWIAASRSDCTTRAGKFGFLAGAIAGLATLVRPSWLLFTPFACCISIVCYGERRRQLLIAAALATGFVLAMAPWWVRNYGITGKLTLTTTQFGASLYDGWRPDANGESDMRYVDRFYREQVDADAAAPNTVSNTFEERLDNRMRTAAITWAQENPWRVVQLAGIKFLRVWSPWPNSTEMQSWSFRLAILLGYAPLIALSTAGAVRFARLGWPYAMCVVPAIYFTCLHMIFVGSIRYRQPAVLVMIALAAGFAESMRRSNDEKVGSSRTELTNDPA